MNDLLQLGIKDLSRFLGTHLPSLSDDWWKQNVINSLSFQQRQRADEKGFTDLCQLDLAALLRIFDQNWYDLSTHLNLPREGRSWLKELQTVRNRWAHISSERITSDDTWRDADTLFRLLSITEPSQDTLGAIERFKSSIHPRMQATETSPLTGENDIGHKDPPLTHEDNAPRFSLGDLVSLSSSPATIFPVIKVISGTEEARYRVFQDNERKDYYESQLIPAPINKVDHHCLGTNELRAFLSAIHVLSPSSASLFSMRSGHIDFVPYQYRPALKLIRADRPRLLIADEVGVGKTIEAGLIIKELRARMDISSILVICPKALVAERKWFLEMKRFDENFTPLDGPLLRHCLEETDLDGEWPEQYAKAILPFSLFDEKLILGNGTNASAHHKCLEDLDPPPKFDLVIVDEVHHIRNPKTYLHHGVRYFCENAEAVLFLSATPVQLGSKDLFTLLNVLRPDIVIDQVSFENMAEPNRHINAAVKSCRDASAGWQAEARSALDDVTKTDWGARFISGTPEFQEAYDQLGNPELQDDERVALTRKVEEFYTFSTIINRTRRRDIGEFTIRKAETLAVDFTTEQQDLHDKLLEVIARILAASHGRQNVKFMMTTIRRQAASCIYGLAPLLKDIIEGNLDHLEGMDDNDTEIIANLNFIEDIRVDSASLIEQAALLDDQDPKVEEFIRVILEKGKLDKNKAMVFSTFRHTLSYLSGKLEAADVRHGLIHGSIPDRERSSIRRRFSLDKDDPEALDVLLSSEVGCEGLDFQFCDFLINYDLPWNPMRIEQRIGRIDRYGQKSESVSIINLITPGTVDADIYQRCLLRIGVFQHAIGGNEEILGDLTRKIRNIEENLELTPDERKERLLQLADNEILLIQETDRLEKNQSELLGLNVPRQSWQDAVESAEDHWLSPGSLSSCVSAYLKDRLGGDGEYFLGAGPAKNLRLDQPSRGLLLEDWQALTYTIDDAGRRWEKWLKGNNPNLSVAFSQDGTLADREVTHITITHPLLRQAACHWKEKGQVLAALSCKHKGLTSGKYYFAIYRWKKVGVKGDEELVAVVKDPGVEGNLLEILKSAEIANLQLPEQKAFDDLDARHHEKWSAAQANHVAANRELVEHRVQSLKISHQARQDAISDKIARAENDNIKRMRQGQLDRANLDFDRHMADLQRAAESSDIHASPILLGVIEVT
ncbi:helicase-related protein [Verrucomicrobiales bacterium]|nr:helicase-related protein [Verrucomicrobiales bacterium]